MSPLVDTAPLMDPLTSGFVVAILTGAAVGAVSLALTTFRRIVGA